MKINGMDVKDATQKVKIKITKTDCTKGATKDPGACAAARACLRQVPDCHKARVHIGRTYLQVGEKWLRFQTPLALRSEIISFDRGGAFEPGDYELRPLSVAERKGRGKRHSSGAPKHGRPGHHRIKPHIVTGVRQHGANR